MKDIVTTSFSKYQAQPIEIDGICFASKGEGRRFSFLKLREAAGEIQDLIYEKKLLRFPIEINGVKVCIYEADFMYSYEGISVIEDFKGMETPVFKLKYKMFKAYYPTLNLIKVTRVNQPIYATQKHCGDCQLKEGNTCPNAAVKRKTGLAKKINKNSKICRYFINK